jgi:hypothetical protein
MKLIKDLGMQFPTDKSKKKAHYGLYECPICGNHFKTTINNIKRHKSTKCKPCSNITHGESNTRLFRIWDAMLQRCTNKNKHNYKYYGGRGIKVCDEWNKYEIFSSWAKNNGYDDSLSIDRIDNDGNYEPSNCRWATQATQHRNTRRICATNTSGYRGVSYYGPRQKWRARITVDGKHNHLGYFDDKMDAAMAYDEFVIKNDLEHTRNFISKTGQKL